MTIRKPSASLDKAETGMRAYVQCMEEIKRRTEFVRDFHNHSVGRFALPVVAETIGLQIRKTLELVAKASLAAHRAVWDEASLWFKKDWNAKIAISKIEQVNPQFYPIPVRESKIYTSGPVAAEWENVPEAEYLTKVRLISAYDAIGKMMHAHLPDDDVGYPDFLDMTQVWRVQIHDLLAMHQVRLLGVPDEFFLVQMNVNGRIAWTRWSKLQLGDR